MTMEVIVFQLENIDDEKFGIEVSSLTDNYTTEGGGTSSFTNSS